MTDAHVTVGGHACERVTVSVPGIGPWHADCDFTDDAPGLAVGARTSLVIGARSFSGTIRETNTYGLRRQVRLVAGADGWGSIIKRRDYHNDAGVKALTVATDAAREAGEVMGNFTGAAATVGTHYLRASGVAACALEHACKGAPWWVDYDGVTHVGQRAVTAATPGTYEVMRVDLRNRTAEIVCDDLSVGVGSTLSDGLDAPVTLRSLEIVVTPESQRILGWFGAGKQSALADALRAVVERVGDGRNFGVYRYRVVQMQGARVELQAVKAADGIPDAVQIDQWHGMAGVDQELAQGSIVLVQFIGGDTSDPAIVSYGGKDTPNAVPLRTSIAGGGAGIGRQGDLVRCGGIGTTVTFTPLTPAPGPMTPGVPYLISFDAIPPSPLKAAPLWGSVATASLKANSG